MRGRTPDKTSSLGFTRIDVLGQTRKRSLRFGLILGLMCAVFTNLDIAGDSYRLIDKKELKRAIAALYAAEQASDWTAFYGMMSPEVRKEMTLAEFLREKESRDFRVVSWRILRLVPLAKQLEAQDVESAASAAMDVLVERPDGKREQEEDQTDYWVRVNGHWYWYWRGWPAD